MSMLLELLIGWGVLTSVLIALLIYRSTLTMQEDDQLFLSDGDAHMQREQMEIMRKVKKISPFVRGLGAVSGLMIMAIAGLAIYDRLHQMQ